MNSKNPIYYWTECGCKLHAKDLKRNYNIPACREHNKPVVKRTRRCLDCEKEHTIPGKRGATIRCDPCNKKQRMIIAKKHADKQYKKILAAKGKVAKSNSVGMMPVKRYINPIPKKMRPFIKNKFGDYCRKLSLCLKLHKNLSCDECDNYVGIFKGHDPRKMEQFTVR